MTLEGSIASLKVARIFGRPEALVVPLSGPKVPSMRCTSRLTRVGRVFSPVKTAVKSTPAAWL